jgi:hypothetical protein
MNIKKKLCLIIGHKKTINGFPTTVCPRCGHTLIYPINYPTDEDVKKRKMKLDPPVPSPARRDEQNNSSTQNAEQVDNNALNMALYHMMLHSDTLDSNQNHTDSNTTHQSDSNSDSYRNDYDSGGSSYDNSSSNGYYDSGYSSSDSTSTSWDY